MREDSAVVTSRDGYNRNRPARRASEEPREASRTGSNWELDADELDRYMSGQPAREPRFDPYGRSQSSGRTERPRARQPQPEPQQPLYDDYEDYQQPTQQPESAFVDDGYAYEDEYDYDSYQADPEPEPTRERPQPARRQARPVARSRQREPEYDDDLYEDPYVLDDDLEEAPRRPQRRPQRSGRARAGQSPAGFTLPPVITEAPIVKDRTALIMMGVAVASVLAMIIVVLTRRDGLDAAIYTHVNANGDPANLQKASAIWNLPLIAGMVTVISLVLAWFLARWSEFLPRFLLGGSIGVQFIVWVAVIAYLF